MTYLHLDNESKVSYMGIVQGGGCTGPLFECLHFHKPHSISILCISSILLPTPSKCLTRTRTTHSRRTCTTHSKCICSSLPVPLPVHALAPTGSVRARTTPKTITITLCPPLSVPPTHPVDFLKRYVFTSSSLRESSSSPIDKRRTYTAVDRLYWRPHSL